MPRILIIRPSAIGDVVMASAMLPAIKKAWPQVSVSWVLEPHLLDLLRYHPAIEEVIPWPKTKWLSLLRQGRFVRLLKELVFFSRLLREREYDMALETTGLLKGRLLAYLSGARERVGFESREPGRFLMTRVISRGPQNHWISSEYRYLLESLGIDTEDFRPFLYLPGELRERVRESLFRSGIREEAFILFCPFTTRPQKHWFLQRWIDLARVIRERLSMPVVLLGGVGDRELAQKFGSLAINLVGQTSLLESAAVVSLARVVVGVDTGLTHMGVALDRPTVALFGATRPYLHTMFSKVRILYRPRPCSPCRRRVTCDHRYHCMREITVREVLAKVTELIEGDHGA